jgi:uncharacterized protein DUF3570
VARVCTSRAWTGLAAFASLLLFSMQASAQDLPEQAVQVDFSGYFDSFQVNIVYPSVSVTRHLGERTAVTGRYLVDVISAASTQSRFDVDGVSSATQNTAGGQDPFPDELRQEVSLGFTRQLGRSVVGLDGLYSIEHDYSSATVAGRISIPFALKNTTFQMGLVHSIDRVFPDNRTWRRNKSALTLSSGVTQVLGKRLITRIDGSWIRNRGFLSDPYQIVRVFLADGIKQLEVVHPDARDRLAVGIETRYMMRSGTVLDLSYRVYRDDWDVTSHTWSAGGARAIAEGMRLGGRLRVYRQSRASFFKPQYDTREGFRTVDTKLDRLRSVELSGDLSLDGSVLGRTPVLGGMLTEDVTMVLRLGFYARRSQTPNWHSKQRTLYAYLISVGYKFNF